MQHQELKDILFKKLIQEKAFWSYDMSEVKSISDEALIEKTIVSLGHKDLKILFEVFPKNRIKKVWRERLAIAGDYHRGINYMMCIIYFDIKDPNRYLKTVITKHCKKLEKLSSHLKI
jgi:hypothetical protein